MVVTIAFRFLGLMVVASSQVRFTVSRYSSMTMLRQPATSPSGAMPEMSKKRGLASEDGRVRGESKAGAAKD